MRSADPPTEIMVLTTYFSSTDTAQSSPSMPAEMNKKSLQKIGYSSSILDLTTQESESTETSAAPQKTTPLSLNCSLVFSSWLHLQLRKPYSSKPNSQCQAQTQSFGSELIVSHTLDKSKAVNECGRCVSKNFGSNAHTNSLSIHAHGQSCNSSSSNTNKHRY